MQDLGHGIKGMELTVELGHRHATPELEDRRGVDGWSPLRILGHVLICKLPVLLDQLSVLEGSAHLLLRQVAGNEGDGARALGEGHVEHRAHLSVRGLPGHHHADEACEALRIQLDSCKGAALQSLGEEVRPRLRRGILEHAAQRLLRQFLVVLDHAQCRLECSRPGLLLDGLRQHPLCPGASRPLPASIFSAVPIISALLRMLAA